MVESRKMALKRIGQLEKSLCAKLRNITGYGDGWVNYSYELSDIETYFAYHLQEVNNLIEEYKLDKTLHESFRQRVAKKILVAAEKRKEYSWAAAFGKKHAL